MTEAELQAAITHMNADHADAVLLYAQAFARMPAARSARMTGLDGRAMRLRVQTEDGEHDVEVPLSRPAATLGAVRDVLVEMVRVARQQHSKN